MKHFIWMLCGIFISGLLLGTLSACGAGQFSTAVITTAKHPAVQAAAAPETDPAPAEQPEDPPEPKPGASITAEEDEARMLAYGKALWDMYLLGLRPDGEELERASDLGPAEGNRFALADLNGDGAEELIVCWDQACMAGMQGLVYTYDYPEEELRLVLSEFPALTFYENGTAAADWSHSQGWAGRFWPVTLYRYSEESGVYEEIGSVDAWDLECTEGDETLAAAFPRDVDADGDGLVYYILTGEWYKNDRTPSDGRLDGRLWDTDPVDGAALEEWMNAYTGGTEPLEIPYRHMGDIQISDLGYPSPEVAYPEPAG
nr:hypothetical protein [uncultured Oscillibacter sp.]